MRAGLRASASKSSWMATDIGLLDRVNAVVKSPGVPPEAPVIAAARERA